MLRVRVFMHETWGKPAMVWQGPLRIKHEDRVLQEYRELSWNTRSFGEVLDMKFSDAAGGGCKVQGSFLGAAITVVEGGHQIDLNFSGANYRVW